MNRAERNSSEILGVLGFEPAQELTPVLSPINQVSAQPGSVMIGGVEHRRIPKNELLSVSSLTLSEASSEPWDFSIGADKYGAIDIRGSGNPKAVIEAMRRIVSQPANEDYDAVTVDVRSKRQQMLATARPIKPDRDNYVAVALPTKDRAPRVKRALFFGSLALATLTSFNASTGRLTSTDMAANVQATLASPLTMYDDASWLIKKVR